MQNPEPEPVAYAAGFIRRGQVVGIPTDTFYGLAADPFNLAAVEQIYRVKGRPETRALPILVQSIEQSVDLVRTLPDGFVKLAEKFWPGALTIVAEASRRLPLKVTGNTGRVALRMPNAPVVWALIQAFGGPITGTSANLSGHPSSTNAELLSAQLGERLPLILDGGETGAVLASTILDLREDGWRIIREGRISEEEIRAVIEGEAGAPGKITAAN
ncbi:MAG TPA: L-threonylcarbamoyladenylate synthase [Candidatus Acidoferrales bacterium]|nr:L-threonylcarbamoyladenylate synthase [Candidatus Acidoferrales bacterium]